MALVKQQPQDERDTKSPAPDWRMPDTLLSKLGSTGRYQVLLFLLLALNMLPVAFNHLAMVFYGVSPPHHCRVPSEWPRNDSFPPPQPGQESPAHPYDSCRRYRDPTNHYAGTESCKKYGYEFYVEGNEWTVVTEWGLVCDLKYLPRLLSTLYFCGVMVGAVLFGHLGDRFGRMPVMLVCLYTQAALGIALHFVISLPMFIGFRILMGMLVQGLQSNSYTLLLELFPVRLRSYVGVAGELFWALGVILLGLAAYFIQHWRYIQLAISLPAVVTILYIWIIPESIRWLISKGKTQKALKVAAKIARWNHITLDKNLETHITKMSNQMDQSSSIKKYNQVHLVRTPRIRKRTLIMCYLWFSIALCYYGIMFNMVDLSGDKYMNFLIGGVLELVAYCITLLVVANVGRRVCLCVYMLLGGGLCVIAVTIQRINIDSTIINADSLVTSVMLLSKAAIVSSYAIVFLYTNELFPTVMRSMAFGTCLFFTRVGGLVAPQIVAIGDYTYESVPFILYGLMCLLGGALSLLLPETKGKSIPDVVADVEETHEKLVVPSPVSNGSISKPEEKMSVTSEMQPTMNGHLTNPRPILKKPSRESFSGSSRDVFDSTRGQALSGDSFRSSRLSLSTSVADRRESSSSNAESIPTSSFVRCYARSSRSLGDLRSSVPLHLQGMGHKGRGLSSSSSFTGRDSPRLQRGFSSSRLRSTPSYRVTRASTSSIPESRRGRKAFTNPLAYSGRRDRDGNFILAPDQRRSLITRDPRRSHSDMEMAFREDDEARI